MEPDVHAARPPAALRMTRCLWCHRQMAYLDALKQRGVCSVCQNEGGPAGWNLIYDRDRHIGAVPANLRAAYGL